MKLTAKYFSIIISLALITQAGCKKQDDWLDVKRNKSDVRPETVADFQALLDNVYVINNTFSTLGLVGTDNITVPDDNLNSIIQIERNAYLWSKDIWIGGEYEGWSNPYTIIELSNVVFDGIGKADHNDANYNNVLGQAYFYRSIAFYTLAQLFCKPYDKGSALQDAGLPLRLTSDVNVIEKRSSVQATYDQMISDAKQAASLLSQKQVTLYRPCHDAALALLAKIYLNMEDYQNAFSYSDEMLKSNNNLLDFNSNLVSASLTYRFPAFGAGNPEILFYAQGGYSTTWANADYQFQDISDDFYNSYNVNDLRKALFYDSSAGAGNVKFRGSYSGDVSNFCGLATNEVFLIRAEANARLGHVDAAMVDLNSLLKKRYRTGTFTDLTAVNADDALKKVLVERRKELPLTSQVRWEDLRRLNKDPEFQVTLKRLSNGVTYTLPPNDPNYVLPIPDEEIQVSGITQNQRH